MRDEIHPLSSLRRLSVRAYGKVVPVDAELAAEVFAGHRDYLLGVSYRLTGSWADAEDLVAEAWPRWERHSGEVREPRAWLTRVVGRLSLDHLRSARVRRESYVGPWLPEPLVSSVAGEGRTGAVGSGAGAGADQDPIEVLVREESVRMAFLVVLDELSPEQRLAFVLHDVIGMDFADIAEVIGCSVSAARQHASRGRRRLADAKPAPRSDADDAWKLLGEMSTALFTGDVDRLMQLLAPDVVLLSDGAGQVLAARRPVLGADEVGRFLSGLARKYSVNTSFEPVLVNGDPGFMIRVDSTRAQDPKIGVYTFTVCGGKIAGLFAVLAPDKLTRLTQPSPRRGDRMLAQPRTSRSIHNLPLGGAEEPVV